MSLKVNKPHVWVYKKSGYYYLSIIADCDDGLGISKSSDYCYERVDENRLLVYFRVHEMGSYDNTCEYQLGPDTGSVFDSAIHDKVTIVLTDMRDRTLGFHTVQPLHGDFSTSGNSPIPKPHIYLKSYSADNAMLHIEVSLPIGSVLSDIQENDDFVAFKREVKYIYECTDFSAVNPLHIDYPLNESSHYDPVLDDITVEFIIMDSRGAVDRKGTGTTHNAEGDASGND